MTEISEVRLKLPGIIMDNEENNSSSIIEFLNQEKNCMDYDNESELDVESLFEEINRLSDNTDERSVDEIMLEAELLMQNDSFDLLLSSSRSKSTINNKLKQQNISKESTPREMKEISELQNKKSKITTTIPAVNKTQKSNSTSNLNIQFDEQKHLVTMFNGGGGDDRINQLKNKRRRNFNGNIQMENDNNCLINNNVNVNVKCNDKLSNNNNICINNDNNNHNDNDKMDFVEMNNNKTKKKTQNYLLNETFVKNNNVVVTNEINHKSKPQSQELESEEETDKTFIDKSTSPAAASPTQQFSSWTREREIENLKENLKDTEERFQSLRLQHDSLSQIHRTVKENCQQFQDETEKLKMDAQHLSECANILRSELQTARSDRAEAIELQKILQTELDETRTDRKKNQEQREKDGKIIQDLQRQCREMERILMRKHPDSVSALIVASKNTSSNSKDDNSSSSRHLLEQRISQLETDAREQDHKAQKILANVQARFSSVQSKYETHIADLETQVLSLQEINSKLNEKLTVRIEEITNYNKRRTSTSTTYSQTEDIAEKESNTISVGSQTDNKGIGGGGGSSSSSSSKVVKKTTSKLTNSFSSDSIHPNNTTIMIKEDAHLLATIRGFRVDLAIKEKAMQRLTRELDECKKTIKKLQKERDVYLKSDKPPGTATSHKKVYDPSQFTEGSSSAAASADLNNSLKAAFNKIKLLEFDYKNLHEKRLQDLKTLQAAHERELATTNETVKVLQGRLSERDDSFVSSATTTPTQKKRNLPIDYYALKAKVSSLEKRHVDREQRLHLLVDALSKGRLVNGDLERVLKDNNSQLKKKYDLNSST